MAALLRKSRALLSSISQTGRIASAIRHYGLNMDDDGDTTTLRTTVTNLNEDLSAVYVDTFSPIGFRLNNGIRIVGPCAVFPKSVLHWNVGGIADVNEDSLSLFGVLEPKIDILVIGVGEHENLKKFDSKLFKILKAKGINAEVLATDQALSLFNFLNSEKRYVAGAFIPPSFEETADSDTFYLAGDRVTDHASEPLPPDGTEPVGTIADVRKRLFPHRKDPSDPSKE